MTERKAPFLFSFKAPGDFVDGIICRIDKVEVKGKPCTQYTLQCEGASTDGLEGELVKILGTYDIDTKLSPNDKGKFVQIAYARERRDVASKGNPMREFQVLIDDTSAAPVRPAPNGHDHEITDEDIPF
jgi:hypothetical protein